MPKRCTTGLLLIMLACTSATACMAEGELPAVENNPPVAEISGEQDVLVGATVTLDGSSSSDPDGDELDFRWSLFRPDSSRAELSSLSLATVTFEPDVAGTYTVELIVNDGRVDSELAQLVVEASHPDVPPVNEAPVANPGSDQNVQVGEVVELDGTESSDPDGDSITYDWLIEGFPDSSEAELDDPGSATPSFVADQPGTYEISLVVSDGELTSRPETVFVEAFEPTTNAPPNASAEVTGETEVEVGARVDLDGSASSDPDGDEITYMWTFVTTPQASQITINDAQSAQAHFTPDEPGEYQVELTVSDSEHSSSDTVTVTATAPVTAPTQRGQLIITEVMANPDALSDAVGEWFEIYNPSSTDTYELQGCVIEDLDADSHTIGESLVIGPESYLTFARSADPGFTPDHVFMGFLANGEDELILSCAGVGIADVAWGPTLGPEFPVVAGRSATLPLARYDEDLNDDGSLWCLSSQVYVSVDGVDDTGTPGMPNEHAESCP